MCASIGGPSPRRSLARVPGSTPHSKKTPPTFATVVLRRWRSLGSMTCYFFAFEALRAFKLKQRMTCYVKLNVYLIGTKTCR